MNKLFNTLLCVSLCLCCSLGFAQKKNNPKTSTKTTISQPANTNTEKYTRAHLKLAQRSIDFGTIPMGKTKVVEVSFTNIGVKPLIITDTYTNCGCTSIEFPEEPFAPKKSGKLKISYDADEEGFFSKTITIFSNADNKKEVIKIQGIVSKD